MFLKMFAQVLLYTNQTHEEILDTAALMDNLVKNYQNCDVHLRRSRVRGDVGNSPFSRGRYNIERSRASAAISRMPEKGQR